MNKYRNIAWVFGMKIFSFNHNSLDFVAVFFVMDSVIVVDVKAFEDSFLTLCLKYF